MGNNGADAPKRTWRDGPLGWFVGLFSIVGLALSVASFVENLHMGKEAIAYVVSELSKIDGWADAVQAVAAILHAGLDWWRGVLRDLLSFLPLHVPQWLHDPVSAVFFLVSRVYAGFFSVPPTHDGSIGNRKRVVLDTLAATTRPFAMFGLPASILMVADNMVYPQPDQELKILSFAIIGVLATAYFWYFRSNAESISEFVAEEAQRFESGQPLQLERKSLLWSLSFILICVGIVVIVEMVKYLRSL